MQCKTCRKTLAVSPSRQGQKFCSLGCYTTAIRKPGTRKYKKIAVNGKSILYHRWLMEQHLGYKLPSALHVHHKDGNTLNNAMDNLEVIDIKDHGRISTEYRKHL